MYDYSKLRGKIKEVYSTEGSFSKDLGMSGVSLSGRLNNKLSWNQPEMIKVGILLDIPKEELHQYFFTKELK